MSEQLIREIEQRQFKADIPEFRVGDTVRVGVRVVEGARERVQEFEGVVIRRRSGGINENFTLIHQGDDAAHNTATALYEYLSELSAHVGEE